MFEDLIFPSNVFQPSEASILHDATRKAIATVGAMMELNEDDRRSLASDVMRIAKSGFSRSLDGLFDMDALADAAVARFLSFKRERSAKP
ncbi:MAG: hypothetical protein P4L76_07705 [Beijerinckiaceae bacterium]|jgi:hypothetical protein|nr:hypothetical protein [Beijerinckiaceae bacterium]